MDIRTRLTFQFVILISLLMLLAFSVIYYSSEIYREDEFNRRLKNKGENAVQLLMEVDEINSELFKKIDQKNPVNLPEEEISIFDSSRRLIFQKKIHSLKLDEELLLSDLSLKNSKTLYAGKNQIIAFAANSKNQVYYVVTSGLDVFGYSKLKNLRNTMAITFGFSLIVLWFLGRIFARRAFKPVIGMVHQVQEMNIQDLGKRLNIENPNDEIGQLGATFNELLARIEKVFTNQKNFISNASHELRTPLTSISGQLEVELLTDRTNEEYKATIESTLEDMKSLNEIANKLLVLAHTSSENQDHQFEPLRVDEVLWQARYDILKRYPNAKINIEFEDGVDDEKSLVILGNEQLLKIAFLNLIDNGCKYSTNQFVHISVSVEDTFCMITFTDQGIGIGNEDIKHIFEPFYRSRQVTHTKGHGIGLSLVEKIISSHNGEISVQSSSHGTRFIVKLSIAS